MLTILLRTILIYLILLFVLRMMGKRQIGELDLTELVITLMLSELAVEPITDGNIPLLYALVPILTLISLEMLISAAETKSTFIKNILPEKPNYLIERGVLNQKELEKQRITMDELLCELRLKDISDIGDVYYAILERNGRLSVFPRQSPERGVMHPIILDGQLLRQNLRLVGRDEVWLRGQLAERQCGIKDVFLFTVDDNGEAYFCKKER